MRDVWGTRLCADRELNPNEILLSHANTLQDQKEMAQSLWLRHRPLVKESWFPCLLKSFASRKAKPGAHCRLFKIAQPAGWALPASLYSPVRVRALRTNGQVVTMEFACDLDGFRW
jgi:hypothetical protein